MSGTGNATAKVLHAAEGCNVKFTLGQRYMGGFVGSKSEEKAWSGPHVDKWVKGVEALVRVAWRHPQTTYAGLVWCPRLSGSTFAGSTQVLASTFTQSRTH